jgi:hypothetical protein
MRLAMIHDSCSLALWQLLGSRAILPASNMRALRIVLALLLLPPSPAASLSLAVRCPDLLWPELERLLELHPLPAGVAAARSLRNGPEPDLLECQLGAGSGYSLVGQVALAPVSRMWDDRQAATSAEVRAGTVRIQPLSSISLPDIALPVDGLTADMPGYPLRGEIHARLLSDDRDLRAWFDALPLPPSAPESPSIGWIGAVGDIMPARGVDVALAARQGIERVFGDTLPVLASCGLLLGNLEAAATASGAKAAKTFTFRFDKAALGRLAAAGFGYLSIANNHTFDFGRTGFLDTLASLAAAGIGTSGAGRDEREASQPFVAALGRLEVRVLSFGAYPVDRTGFDGRRVARAGAGTPGTLWLDDAGIAAAARAFTPASFDIALVHGGEEWNTRPTEEQQRLYRSLISAGADLVLGSHPHVLQGMQAVDGKLIAYSLGNFLFPGMEGTPGGEDSVILKLGVYQGRIRYVLPVPVRLRGATVSTVGDPAKLRILRARSRALGG